jgi:MazG family protein
MSQNDSNNKNSVIPDQSALTKPAAQHAGFDELVAVMAALRADNGCPWDRQQTMATIKDYFLEEAYEAIEAIEGNNPESIKEELGDVLFEVCFLARIAEESGQFTVYDSIRHIVDKLIRRHPHVFGDEKVTEAAEVPGRWAKLKAQERAEAEKGPHSILDGVPAKLPALLQALRISERAVAIGFEWETPGDVLDKLQEEMDELREAVEQGQSRERLEDELGDLFFTLVNVGRKLSISPHDSLMRTLRKFRRRFGWVEEELYRQGVALEEAGMDRLEALWQAAKKHERS